MAAASDVNLVGVVRHGEKYLFFYADDRAQEAILRIRQMAADPDLSLDYYDAAVLCQRIRQERPDCRF